MRLFTLEERRAVRRVPHDGDEVHVAQGCGDGVEDAELMKHGIRFARVGASEVRHEALELHLRMTEERAGEVWEFVRKQVTQGRQAYLVYPVIEGAKCRVCDLRLEHRCEAVAGDFFTEIPAGADAYYLQHIIHDWEDDQARIILANCRKAIPPDGVLLVVEWDLFSENVPSNGKFIDIVMLILTGGRERSVDEYRDLLASTGFRLNRVIPTAAQLAVIEAFPI